MTLIDLFRRYGIDSPQTLYARTTLHRSYCYHLWSGYRGLGVRLARRLAAELDIPLVDLIQADRVTPRPAARP